jgi:hypothetical protein
VARTAVSHPGVTWSEVVITVSGIGRVGVSSSRALRRIVFSVRDDPTGPPLHTRLVNSPAYARPSWRRRARIPIRAQCLIWPLRISNTSANRAGSFWGRCGPAGVQGPAWVPPMCSVPSHADGLQVDLSVRRKWPNSGATRPSQGRGYAQCHVSQFKVLGDQAEQQRTLPVLKLRRPSDGSQILFERHGLLGYDR